MLRAIGVAYVLNTKSAKDVNVVTKWQGGQYDILEKVPTRIAFAEENNFDEDKWGYDVEPGMKSCQWFKASYPRSYEHFVDLGGARGR